MEEESENSRSNFCQPGEDDAARSTKSQGLGRSRPNGGVLGRSRPSEGRSWPNESRDVESRPNRERKKKVALSSRPNKLTSHDLKEPRPNQEQEMEVALSTRPKKARESRPINLRDNEKCNVTACETLGCSKISRHCFFRSFKRLTDLG